MYTHNDDFMCTYHHHTYTCCFVFISYTYRLCTASAQRKREACVLNCGERRSASAVRELGAECITNDRKRRIHIITESQCVAAAAGVVRGGGGGGEVRCDVAHLRCALPLDLHARCNGRHQRGERKRVRSVCACEKYIAKHGQVRLIDEIINRKKSVSQC